MESSSKETQAKTAEIWHLSQRLGISIWKNLLSLPDCDNNHTPLLANLERSLQFTFISQEKDSETQKVQLFVSEKTDFISLCKYLPFLFEEYQIFLCADNLIQQRIRSLLQDEISDDDDNQAKKVLSFLLEKAALDNASDIHVESLAGSKRVRMRINGKLKQIILPDEIDERLFIKIKLHSSMDIAQKRAPQDGHFPFISTDGKHFDLRVSTIPGIYGEKIVLRILPASSVQFSMVEMGFSDLHIETIQSCLRVKTGMILFTGPTGSGKTTSLYSILKELQSEALNIVTIEDPVEYRLNGITQVEVNNLAGISFASALRSFLRQDPDVILVGEIRDAETAQIAARAAQTGHLVLSTLHSNNVFEAIHRLKSLGVKGDDIATSLKLLVSQRLVPRICGCGKNPDCPSCSGKGVSGRIPVLEMLKITSVIKKMLSFEETISDIEKVSFSEGFLPMRHFGAKLVEENMISSVELDSICPEP
ncbi:MAG: type II/IV secretion system protein [SAR324 cluster bacterium]|nr:type II/IV secretion system protein [SAR324 cluster bacterium]